MKAAAYLLSGVLGLAGIVFLIACAAGNTVPRLIIGLVLIGTALFIAKFARSKVPDQRIIQEIDLSGDITPEEMICNSCGASLDKDSVHVREGGIFVECPYCGTSYQLEEAPKW